MSISTFFGVQTALRGLLAQQRALDVTAHNVANSNTVGYTRQQATLQATDPLVRAGIGSVGSGVDVVAYTRARDSFIDVQLRAQSMLQGFHDARKDGLEQVELVLNEPSDSGVSNLLEKFWSAWQAVANNPESLAARQSLLETSASLATGMQSLRLQLARIDSQTQTNIDLTIDDVNAIVADVAKIDQQVMRAVASGEKPSNDLLDRRDVLLDRLGTLGNLTKTDEADGSVTVQVGGLTLVSGGVQTAVTAIGDFGAGLTSGKLAGLVALRGSISGAGGYLEKLDGVAGAVISSVNGLQTNGFTLTGAAATDLFFTGSDASDIEVNSALFGAPGKIGASNRAGEPGNGENAIAIAALRGSSTIDGAYHSLVTTIGSHSQEAQRSAANARVLSDALENRRSSLGGVSLDEEMTNLVRFQRAYQASARALSAMDEMIELLVTRTGRVGL